MQQSRLTAFKNSLFCYYRNSGNLRQKLCCMRLKQIPVKGESGSKKIYNQSVNWSPLARPAGDTGEKLSGDTVKQQLLLYHSSPQSLTCHRPHTAILSDQVLLFLRNNRFLSPTSLTVDWTVPASLFWEHPTRYSQILLGLGLHPGTLMGNILGLCTPGLSFSTHLYHSWGGEFISTCLLNPVLPGSIQTPSYLLQHLSVYDLSSTPPTRLQVAQSYREAVFLRVTVFMVVWTPELSTHL